MIYVSQSGDKQNSLLNYLYADQAGDTSKLPGDKAKTEFLAKVVKIEGQLITLDRPLMTDLRPEWKARISSLHCQLQESALEDLSLEFPETEYRGHFTEKGFNGIVFGTSHRLVGGQGDYETDCGNGP